MSGVPRCCECWPECTHTLALYERFKRGGKMSSADMRRFEVTENAFTAPVADQAGEGGNR
jgi:hypothetical protein